MFVPTLINRAEIHAACWLDSFLPIIEASLAEAENCAIAREAAGASVDPFAERCAVEALVLLNDEEPRVHSALFALEAASACEPDIFGPTYRLFRKFAMRSLLGAARGAKEPEVRIAEPS